MASEDIAAYVDSLLYGALDQPGRRYALVDGVMEPIEQPPYRPTRPHINAPRWQPGIVHRLYRWYDADGVLLYVGVTYDLAGRSSAHVANSYWMRYATRMESEPTGFTARDECEDAELRAIREERPVFNVAGQAAGYRQRQVDYVLAHETSREDTDEFLRWTELY